MGQNPTMSETTPAQEPIYVPHQEFRAGLPAGHFRLIVNPERASKYVKHRLMLTVLILPIVGAGIGMAWYGYPWLGLVMVLLGIAAHRIVARQAPKILLHMALRDPKVYHEAIDFEILEVRRAR